MRIKQIVFFLTIALCNISLGQQVTSKEAISKACQLANRSTRIIKTFAIGDSLSILPITENNDTLLFLVKDKSRTIIVPGVKKLPPILGVINFASNNVDDYFEVPGTSYFLNRYVFFVKSCLQDTSLEILPLWTDNNTCSEQQTRSLFIDTLITSLWGQSKANQGYDPVAYNYYVEETCERCTSGVSLSGCGAVAMGQVMNFYKYPILQMNKKASEQIDWCNMPDTLDADEQDYEKKRDAVAHLLRDCGLACDMSYCYRDECQSFAWPRDIRKALVKHFSYSSDATLIKRSDYPDFAWKTLLIGQLTNKHPVIYANLTHDTNSSIFNGYNGHIHICDGYDEAEDMFHFNFGWTYHYNGWYNIDNFIVDNENYNLFERAIIDIYPQNEPDLCNYTLALSNYYHFYYDIYNYNEPAAYSNIPKVANVLYSAPESNSVPASWRTIPSGATAEYVAHEEVILLPGFTAEYGSDFTARIEPCEACEERMVQMDIFLEGDTNPDIDTSDYNLRMLKSGDTSFVFRPSALMLFPNPSTQTLTVQTSGDINDLQIFDQSGRPVFRWYIESRSNNEITLNIGNIPVGAYILRVVDKDRKTNVGHFVKK